MSDGAAKFRDRSEAGRKLGERLGQLCGKDAVILGIPRGGVSVAAEVANVLGATLDVMVARKLGHPRHPEFGVGAIAAGVRVLDEEAMQSTGVALADLEPVERKEGQELQRRIKAFRAGRPPPHLTGRVVVVVDDGVATSVTAKAALRSVRAQKPAHLIFAAPVASREAVAALRKEADEVVVLATPHPFMAVGAWYEDFTQVEDDEVRRDLEAAYGPMEQEVQIDAAPGTIAGTLRVPPHPLGVVLFAHGSGSSRHSPRNQAVAKALGKRGLATLLMDLLTPEEERVDAMTREHRFDIQLLARRLESAMKWLRAQDGVGELGIGLFGSSTGAACSLVAASKHPDVRAVVSRGGRPDLAGKALPDVRAPTLLIVGSLDDVVIQLNQEARAKMTAPATLEIVPGATHLFEEPGKLERVSELAGDWFARHLPKRPPRPQRATPSARGVAQGRPLGKDSMDDLVDRMAKKRLVLMGEATHGTHEFYEARAQLSLRLIEEHGFDFVAVEGDWPDCFRANQWAKRGTSKDATEVLKQFTRWPTWMWANREVAGFLGKLATWNQGTKQKAGFYGLDVYSLWDSLHETMRYLERIGGPAEQTARDALACFEPFAADPHEYARRVAWVPQSCRDEVVEMLAATRAGLPALPDSTTEARLDAEQNAVVAHNAEVYYRAWAQGGPASWNVRDRHMMETLERLLDYHTAERGRAAKGIVWAHNTHVGDASATDMREDGMTNIGQLAREQHPGNAFLLGFSTYEGSVIAGRSWEAPMTRMPVPAARRGSLEECLHQAGGDRVLFLPEAFPARHRIGHRAIGVVYHPEREAGNYVPSVVRERYDALIHFDRTTAVQPLGIVADHEEVPVTWPSGM